MKNLLPGWLHDKIMANYLYDYISELRIRINKPIVICYKGKYEIIREKNNFNTEIIATNDLISYIITIATKQSYYAFENQIKKSYITTDNGIRIGLCGTVVVDEDKVTTIKNFTSLNIRIPHSIKGCSKKVIDLIHQKGNIKNTLIISPPGAGKTTFVRDIAEKLSNDEYIGNILIVDERFEICGLENCNNLFFGKFADIISGCSKNFAFNECLKTMNPNVVIADEISEEKDIDSIIMLANSGVKIIATAHVENINELKLKKNIKKAVELKIFKRIVVLSKRKGIGTIDSIFDENFNLIYFPLEL